MWVQFIYRLFLLNLSVQRLRDIGLNKCFEDLSDYQAELSTLRSCAFHVPSCQVSIPVMSPVAHDVAVEAATGRKIRLP